MDKDAATDDIKEIGKMAGKAGQDIADDATMSPQTLPQKTQATNPL